MSLSSFLCFSLFVFKKSAIILKILVFKHAALSLLGVHMLDDSVILASLKAILCHNKMGTFALTKIACNFMKIHICKATTKSAKISMLQVY